MATNKISMRVDVPIGTIIKTPKCKYKLIEPLSEGGNGCVWRIQSEIDSEFFILKLYFPRESIMKKDKHAKDRFIRERKVLSKIKHDHIVKIFDDYGELPIKWNMGDASAALIDGVWCEQNIKSLNEVRFYPYFLLESCDYNLSEYVRYYKHDKGKLTLEKCKLMIQICEGVKALHDYNGERTIKTDEKNYHRDLKPENILVR